MQQRKRSRCCKVEEKQVEWDDTVLLAESEGMLQRIVDKFDRVCKRRKLEVNSGKSKVIVFERACWVH